MWGTTLVPAACRRPWARGIAAKILVQPNAGSGVRPKGCQARFAPESRTERFENQRDGSRVPVVAASVASALPARYSCAVQRHPPERLLPPTPRGRIIVTLSGARFSSMASPSRETSTQSDQATLSVAFVRIGRISSVDAMCGPSVVLSVRAPAETSNWRMARDINPDCGKSRGHSSVF